MLSRLSALIIVFFLGYSALVFKLYNLQLSKGDYYLAQAQSQYAARDALSADRGAIYFTDKNGNRLPAVTTKDFPQIYAVPKEIEDPTEAAHMLAGILNRSAKDLLIQFDKPKDQYELLAKKAEPETASKAKDLKLKGLYVENVSQRFYPFGTLAAHLLGFVAPSADDAGLNGKYGIEEFYNSVLAGRDGTAKEGRITPARNGEDITLTIDPNIQKEAERVLKDTMDKFGAPGGMFIVAEPKTGKILALGADPGFDPNNYSKYEFSDFINPATQQLYEPGSVFKVITMAAGIDAGKITPDTKYYDNGEIKVSGKTIKNWDLKAHGWMTMTNVLENSLNTGSSFAESKTGHGVFREYLQKFGFGERTGVDLPGELKGDLRGVAANAPAVAFATASFGQGVAVTPMEMVRAVGAIANGGLLMRPYLNADLGPKEIRRVISPESARQVSEMMVSALDKAQIAAVKGYTLAGKTGTAQVPDLKHGGYTNRVIDTYIGFGPTKDPRFIILIRVNEPEGAPHAAETVVPAFRELAQFILNYYNVPPDRI